MGKNKRVPAIRFKGFTEEWEEKQLGDVVSISMGQSPNGENYTNNPDDYILVQGNADIQKGNVVPRVWTTQVTKMADVNDLIFTVRAPVGEVGKTAYNVVIGRGVAAIKGNEFIFQSLKKMNYDGYWGKYSAGSTFDSINSNSLREASLFITIEQEQIPIGEFFQNVDNLINANQRKLEKLKNIKKACLEKMFPKKGATIPEIRFKGFTGEWEDKIMGKIGNTFTGLSGKTKNDFGHGDAEFITYMNVFTNPITNRCGTERVEIDKKQNQVQYGDIFFTTSSETPEEVGMSSVWLNSNKNVYLNSFCFGYRLNEKEDCYYLAYLLRCPSIRKKIAFLAQGISRYNISKNKMMEIDLPFPDIDEQERIGIFFKNLDNLIAKNELQLEKLKNIKKACLEKMFVNTEDAI